jgi:transposase-like protein
MMLSSPACGGTCVLSFSYRDLAELAWELGVRVAPSTILRWVIRYVPEFEKAQRRIRSDASVTF